MISAGRWARVRMAVCGTAFAVLFFAVGKRAYNLQVRDAERLRAMAEEQYLREIELPPRRGRILDRNGADLASTADVDSIYCNPRQLPDPREAARRLALVLGLDRADLEKKLSQRRFFAWVKRRVTPEEAAAVRAMQLPGVAMTREPRRFYPNRTLAATVMGHAGSDGGGLDGVELALDKMLRGTTSSVQGVRDALGREIAIDGALETPSTAGSDVVLTIDRYLTFITERALAAGAAEHHAKGAIAIMMDPRTGEVLAMASVPTFNPNEPVGAAEAEARNRAVTDTYEPGSTMKTFTIAAALDAGAVRPDDKFDCLMGRMMVRKYSIHDTHPHGVLTVAEVFKFSSNIGATKIARRLGRDAFAEALARFGFGRPTGIGLPGERSGVVRPVEKWGDIGFANISFGQGIAVTPLQMIAGVSAIAGGGIYRQPRIVARVVAADGTVDAPAAAPDRRVMSAAAARTMLGIMRGVTDPGGTARLAAIDGYPVAGKTGTAQKVANGHYDPTKWVSSFVGAVPADDPRLAIIVILDEPQGGHLGGAVAAPIFKEIAEQALRYLHVAPSVAVASNAKAGEKSGDKSARELGRDEMPAKAQAVAAAEEAPATDLPLDDDALGDDPALAEKWDEVAGAEGGRSADAPAAVQVPDFTGMSLGQAIHAARRSGVELAFDDPQGQATGIAVRQRPAPGPAARGVVCRVAFGRRAD
ncbi:MAG TPA: penicillin-binding transpeptidase domain-containing protein [Polyangia bacterium]|nr:penicillin-binding transpeptidase domain-containing protein [Polyangia bacterium]